MLSLQNINKCYAGHVVLDNISFDVNHGEIVSILGPSGCGKTTLLNIILGLTQADQGQILFKGKVVSNLPMKQRGFNIVFQDYALFPNLNTRQNIEYGLKNRQEAIDPKEVTELVTLLGLTPHLHKPIELLSGGQKQRVALARTLVMQPKLLLLDEPLSALDGMMKESIKERIKAIAKTYHLSTLIVTHDPEEAMTLSDKILILNEGKVEQYGTPTQIIQRPANDFVQSFILDQLHIKQRNIIQLFNPLDKPIAPPLFWRGDEQKTA